VHTIDAMSHRYKMIVADLESVCRLIVDLVLELRDEAPEAIILDFDATDDLTHGAYE